MAEEAKRLAPKSETLRELFLRSGNLCAYPGCNKLMLSESAKFVGQLCHIEAAEKGGERFNENMTNEQRRAAANLITRKLMMSMLSLYPGCSRSKRTMRGDFRIQIEPF